MKHENGHQTEVIKGSTKKSELGGVEYHLRCCDGFEKSFHHQRPGLYTKEELKRIRQDHHVALAESHHNHLAAIQFLAESENDSENCEDC